MHKVLKCSYTQHSWAATIMYVTHWALILIISHSLFETLPAKNTEFREAWKVHNDALLLYACVHGSVESVATIMQLNSSAQIRRYNLLSPKDMYTSPPRGDTACHNLICEHSLREKLLVQTMYVCFCFYEQFVKVFFVRDNFALYRSTSSVAMCICTAIYVRSVALLLFAVPEVQGMFLPQCFCYI